MTREVNYLDRLKGKNEIAAVYNSGKVIISLDRKIKACHLSSERITHRIRFAIAVSSKVGNSVWRNRVKRIIRETLKQENHLLKEIIFNNVSELSIIFSPYKINQVNLKYPFLKDIKPAVTDILTKLYNAKKIKQS